MKKTDHVTAKQVDGLVREFRGRIQDLEIAGHLSSQEATTMAHALAALTTITRLATMTGQPITRSEPSPNQASQSLMDRNASVLKDHPRPWSYESGGPQGDWVVADANSEAVAFVETEELAQFIIRGARALQDEVTGVE